MTLRSFIVPGVLVALAIAACDDAPPPPPPKAAPEQKPKPLPDPIAAMDNADGGTAEAPAAYVYAYNPVGKRDPFRSPIIDPGKGPDTPIACEGPLANWDLEQLKLVATVTSDANPLGMVEDPGGKGYVVRRNSMMGRLCGKVTEVLRDCITVTEFFQQPDGKRVPNAKKLCLRADVGGESIEDLSTGKKYQ